MAYTRTWDPARPLGNQPARNADDEIRFLRVDLEERLKDLFGIADFTVDPLVPAYLKPSNGTITTEIKPGVIGNTSAHDLALETSGIARWNIRDTTHLEPEGDLVSNIGASAKRIASVYASTLRHNANLTINATTASSIILATSNLPRWAIGGTGDFAPQADDTHNIGSNSARVSSIYANKLYINDLNSDIDGGTIDITTLGVFDIKFRPNDTDRWLFTSAGHLEPAVDNNVNIGSSTKRVNTLHIAGNIYTATVGTIGASDLGLRTNSTLRWLIQSSGHLVPQLSNTYDIGSSSNKVRHGYFGGNLEVTGQAHNVWYNAGNTVASPFPIDWNNGNVQSFTLTGNRTLTFSNPAAGSVYTLYIAQDATGNRTITWPASVKWGANGAPVLSTAAGKVDVVSFLYNGANYLGFVNGYGF